MNTDTSGKKPYHFGNLKETLIEQGIELIHEEGIEKFSLRKVAKKVGVSATACYNHFGNIDELLLGMYSYVTDRFATALKQAVEKNSCQYVTISMGVAYVEFFAKYPHYFNFLFDSEYLGIQIKETEITWDGSCTPFEIFVNGAKIVFNSFRYNKSLKPKKERNGNETGKSCLHSPLPGKGFVIIIEPVINEEIKECRMNFIL